MTWHYEVLMVFLWLFSIYWHSVCCYTNAMALRLRFLKDSLRKTYLENYQKNIGCHDWIGKDGGVLRDYADKIRLSMLIILM